MVESTALEMRHTRKGIGGSNPSLSAKILVRARPSPNPARVAPRSDFVSNAPPVLFAAAGQVARAAPVPTSFPMSVIPMSVMEPVSYGLRPRRTVAGGAYSSEKPLARMNAPKSARSGFAYWRALSSDQP